MMGNINSRSRYLILVLIVLALGIASRKTPSIPLFFGDILYAVMIYYGLRTLFFKYQIIKIAILALLFCFVIEFFQLYDAHWILEIRRTTLGHYILGQGFLWSDLAFYFLGVIVATLLDFCLFFRFQ